MSVLRFDPFGDPLRQMDRLTNQLLSGTRTPMGMPMDVWQSGDGFHVALDLPGVDPASVDITHERNVLTIRAERRSEFGEGDGVLVAERPQGSYTRQLQLGDTVDPEGVQASYADGVLRLVIPVAAKAQPRKIEVQSSGGQQPVQVESTASEAPPAPGEPAQGSGTAS